MSAPILDLIKESDLSKVAIFSGAVVDPDGLASALAMQAIVESLGGSGVCFYNGTFNRPQNKTMRQSLSLQVKNSSEYTPEDFTTVISVDGPSSILPRIDGKPITPDFIIDHHEQSEQASKGNDVRPIGSASAIMWEYVKAAGIAFDTEEGSRLATALAIGIITDTQVGGVDSSSDLDYEALADCLKHKDNKLYQEILNYPEPAYYNDLHNIGWSSKIKGEAAMVAGLGRLPAGRSGAISDLTERFHRTEGTTLAVVFALVEDAAARSYEIHASLRHSRGSCNSDEFMKEVFGCGGGKKNAGGAQVKLPDLFKDIPPKMADKLFDVVKEVIAHKVLKAAGDGARDNVPGSGTAP